MATSAELHDTNDGILRPRPRKPVHSQLSQLTTLSSISNGHSDISENGHLTGQTRCVVDGPLTTKTRLPCIILILRRLISYSDP